MMSSGSLYVSIVISVLHFSVILYVRDTTEGGRKSHQWLWAFILLASAKSSNMEGTPCSKGFSVEDSHWLNCHVYILEPVMVPLIQQSGCVTDESIPDRGNGVIVYE